MQSLGNGPAAHLSAEVQAAKDLLQLLKQEQSHLVNADVDGVSGLTEEKTRLVGKMTELALQRHRALASSGFDAGEAGMQAWLKNNPTPLAAAWSELLEIAKASKEINRTNGILIGQHMARNQAALNILQGNPAGDAIYGPNGHATAKTGSRGLVVG
jgi:flagellar biosynthesis protein FlgN